MVRLLLFIDSLLRAAINAGLLLLCGWIGSNIERWAKLESVVTKQVDYDAWEVLEIAFFVALLAVASSTMAVRAVRKYIQKSNTNLMVWFPLNQWLTVGRVPGMRALCVELYGRAGASLKLLWNRFGFRQAERSAEFRHEELDRDRASPRDRSDNSGEPLHSGNPTIFMGLIALIFGGFIVVIIYNLIIVPVMNFIVLPILRVIAIIVGIIATVVVFVVRVIIALGMLIFMMVWRAWESVLGRVLLVLVGRLPVTISSDGQEPQVTLSTPLWAAFAARISRQLFAVSSIVLMVGFTYRSVIIFEGMQFITEIDRWDKWALLGLCGYSTACLTIIILVVLSEGCWWSVKALKTILRINEEGKNN